MPGARRPRQYFAGPDTSCVALGFEDIFEEVGVAHVLLICSALRNCTIEIRQCRQPQVLRQDRDALVPGDCSYRASRHQVFVHRERMLVANDGFAHWRYRDCAPSGRDRAREVPAAPPARSPAARRAPRWVVACTRAFATSRSHRATAPFAACLSGFRPDWRIEATNATQKLRFR